MSAFEKNLMGKKVAMKFIKGDGFRSEIESCDNAMVFRSNIAINNRIKFSKSHGTTSRR